MAKDITIIQLLESLKKILEVGKDAGGRSSASFTGRTDTGPSPSVIGFRI